MKRHEPRRIAFDCERFYFDVRRTARRRGMSLHQLGLHIGVCHTALSRYRKRPPDGIALAALCKWADLNAADYSIDREPS